MVSVGAVVFSFFSGFPPPGKDHMKCPHYRLPGALVLPVLSTAPAHAGSHGMAAEAVKELNPVKRYSFDF